MQSLHRLRLKNFDLSPRGGKLWGRASEAPEMHMALSGTGGGVRTVRHSIIRRFAARWRERLSRMRRCSAEHPLRGDTRWRKGSAGVKGERLSGSVAPGRSLRLSGGRASFEWGHGQFPELALSDDRHLVSLRGETTDLDQLRSSVLAGDLQRVGTAPHQQIGSPARFGLHDGARPARRGDRFRSRALEEPGEREVFPRQRRDSTQSWLLRSLAERRDQLTRGFVPPAPRSEAAMDHFLEMIAARQRANVLAAHRFRDVAAQQHRRDESDLIDIVALLPPPHPAPRNFR